MPRLSARKQERDGDECQTEICLKAQSEDILTIILRVINPVAEGWHRPIHLDTGYQDNELDRGGAGLWDHEPAICTGNIEQ